MTQAQWLSIIRSLGLFLGGFFVYRGLISGTALSNFVDQIVDAAPKVISAVSAITPIAAFIWSMFAHSTKGTLAAAEQVSLPGTKIVTTAAIANALDSPKVVTKAQANK